MPKKKKSPGARPRNHRASRPLGDYRPPQSQEASEQVSHTDQPTRLPGGQPGNSNALKHGFYSALFKAKERQLLDQIPVADLSAEIELIRVTSTRFLEALAASEETPDLQTRLTALRAVNLSAQSIAALMRIQVVTSSASRDAAEVLAKLDELDEEAPAQPA